MASSMENLSLNLRRYMTHQKLSIPELAERSTVSRATISNILNQRADPSHSILENLCKALNITMTELYADQPVLKSLRYRTNKNMTAREKAAKEILLFTVADKLALYKQVEKYNLKNNILDFSLFSKNPTKAAHELRDYLKISQEQPITNFCGRISELGIKQFYFNFGLSKTFGLSVNKEDDGPAIFVNTGTANTERWIFTIFHELGHLILQPESYNGEVKEEDKNSQEEIDAHEFAAEFLLPCEVLKAKVLGTKTFSFIEKIIEIKREFFVSYKTALRQYCRAFNREYNDVISRFQKIYTNWKKFDFSNFKEPEALSENSFTFEDSIFRNCVFEALKANDMELCVASKLLNKDEESIKKEIDLLNVNGDYSENGIVIPF